MVQAGPLKVIAHIHSDFTTKFGIPRQSGLVDTLRASVVFEPAYRNPDALRGLERYSHLWLLWEFSAALREGWSPTVRPPRLGGNTRMGVFATRSPFRPNPIGLSSVRLHGINWSGTHGPTLIVLGADLMDGSPIYDIKPYLAYTDAHPEATGGFCPQPMKEALEVVCSAEWLAQLPAEKRDGLLAALAQDPRPAYQQQPQRVYQMAFAGFEVRFTVRERCLTVHSILPMN